jgi:hypothetical protein
MKANLDYFVTLKTGEIRNLGIREDLAQFIAFLRNLGKQFSDWEEDMLAIDENAVASAVLSDPNFKRISPEWTYNLTSKIFNMLTVEFQPYLNVKTSTVDNDELEDEDLEELNPNLTPETNPLKRRAEVENFAPFLRQLRMVKFYQDAYKIDWNDELATIEGQISRLIQANKLGLYEYMQTVGNWFISTAVYYSVVFFDTAIGENEIEITENVGAIQEYDLPDYPEIEWGE